MKQLKKTIVVTVAVVMGLGGLGIVSAQNVIDTATGLFAPGFRDGTNSDAGNTTWWGWSPGSFGVPSATVNDPAVTLGIGGLDGAIDQITPNPIVSGTSNIYTGSNFAETLQFTLPTNGSVGTGFTTIIVQGRTAFGGFNVTPGTFSDIAGAPVDLVHANNANGAGQFWAKFEITGNEASYSLDWTMPGFTSVAELTVDTYWSAAGFAPDTAVVPEPSVVLLVTLGLGLLLWRLRRRGTARVLVAGSSR